MGGLSYRKDGCNILPDHCTTVTLLHDFKTLYAITFVWIVQCSLRCFRDVVLLWARTGVGHCARSNIWMWFSGHGDAASWSLCSKVYSISYVHLKGTCCVSLLMLTFIILKHLYEQHAQFPGKAWWLDVCHPLLEMNVVWSLLKLQNSK